MFLIIERKHDARDPHDHKSDNKCNGNREKDTENDGKCFVRIDQLGIGQTFIEDMFQCQAVDPPSSPNTIETVVEVGIPSVLKMSSRMTSVALTARKTHITSAKL